jgi:hypothetical protein
MKETKKALYRAVFLSMLCGPVAWNATTPIAAAAATPQAAPQNAAFKEIQWDDLIPKGWDPYKRFKDRKVGILDDNDPQQQELLSEMRMVWDNAPTVTELEGAAVKIPGYIVPLDEDHGRLKEFLLVPYFGACIHTPPPPANQIIHVFTKTPIKGFKAMDTVWIRGALTQGRNDSYMGTSGYEIRADAVDRYEAPKR